MGCNNPLYPPPASATGVNFVNTEWSPTPLADFNGAEKWKEGAVRKGRKKKEKGGDGKEQLEEKRGQGQERMKRCSIPFWIGFMPLFY